MHIFTDRKKILIDTRSSDEFLAGHVEGSVFVGFGGKQFKWWLELMLPDKDIQLDVIASPNNQDQVKETLQSIGYTHIRFQSLEGTLSQVEHISAETLVTKASDLNILDVREQDEIAKGALPNAEVLPLSDIVQGKLPSEKDNFVVHCAGGYRSLIAISLLKLLRQCHFIQIDGGFSAIKRHI
ncbi:rhodanese domain-containing protein [Photobacterium sp. GB-50]|uniref:rhodanese-like domain-containing protein n=1 Tax=Photobacterium sp. GB-50 TaxID=2022107 RepID=UPI000D172A87|nr:rhodanese-like domain-containing protein [Photobacterium sp. GB-50]PSW74039.1 rhodanese domain-containing protein [Photobacterium sp. GB-50]